MVEHSRTEMLEEVTLSGLRRGEVVPGSDEIVQVTVDEEVVLNPCELRKVAMHRDVLRIAVEGG